MGEANEARSRRVAEALSLEMEKYPRDLLQRFMSSGSSGGAAEQSGVVVGDEDDSDKVELNLGLSLGGRFGVDKSSKKLIRSSSIAGSIPLLRDGGGDGTAGSPAPAHYPTLMRTSSLPVETEEQWRKRKELQSLRRMEAKRRRSEKQRNSTAARDGGLDEERRELDGSTGFNLREKQHFATANRFSSNHAPPFGIPNWAAAARQAIVGAAAAGFVQPPSQGSVESQGGSSSGNSELEIKTAQGLSSCSEARSQEQSNQDCLGASGTKARKSMPKPSRPEMENPSKKPEPTDKKGREIGPNGPSPMEDMPCVFTKGDGPNGRRVDGILYKYGKGEEVRIMCICHGTFLSPADFVKHAGGGEVAHPLRHIVINPSASTSLS